jgi:hypothetical protein
MRNSPDTGIWSSKGQKNENKNQYKNNDLRDRSTLVLELSKTHISIHFWVIYQRTTSTKILTINKYQTIVDFFVVSTELSHPSHEHRHLGPGYFLFNLINKMCIYNIYEPVWRASLWNKRLYELCPIFLM